MRLIVLDGAAAKPRYDLTGPSAIIGRAPDCDIVINDQEASRHHARISVVRGRYTIEDAQAANPTILNGRLLTQPRPLHDGDVIVIGSVMLQVALDPEGPADAETASGVALVPPPPSRTEPESRRTRARPDRSPSRQADNEAPAARPGPRRTRSSPSLRRAEAQKPRQAEPPDRGRQAVVAVQSSSSPRQALRDVAMRLATASDRLQRAAPRVARSPSRQWEQGAEQARARLDAILAQQAALGKSELERLRTLLPDPLNNQTNMRALYALGRAAPELAAAARLAQQLLSLGQDLRAILAGTKV